VALSLFSHAKELNKIRYMAAYNVKDSFQIGLRFALTVFVFCFDLMASDGTSLSLTYGSANPFGSIGFRFRASLTVQHQ